MSDQEEFVKCKQCGNEFYPYAKETLCSAQCEIDFFDRDSDDDIDFVCQFLI